MVFRANDSNAKRVAMYPIERRAPLQRNAHLMQQFAKDRAATIKKSTNDHAVVLCNGEVGSREQLQPFRRRQVPD